jgi:hypothetical protein
VVRNILLGEESSAVTLSERLILGDSTSDQEFSGVREVYPTPSSGALVSEFRPPRVRLFDSAGRFVRQYGRRGMGPGEYMSPVQAAMDSRGLVYVQNLLSGVAIFDSLGNLLSDLRTPRAVDQRHWYVSSDGTVIMLLSNHATQDSSGRPTFRKALIRIHPDRTGLDTLALEPEHYGSTITVPYTVADTPGRSRVPLSPLFHEDFGPRGTWAYGHSGSYAIHVRQLDGKLMRIESNAPRVEVTSAEREALSEEATVRLRGSDPHASVDERMVPALKPSYKDFRHDTDGRIWVELFRPAIRTEVLGCPPFSTTLFGSAPSSSSTKCEDGDPPRQVVNWIEPVMYDVFAESGDFLGRVEIPDRSSFMAARGDHLWLQELDADDVPALVRYRLSFPFAVKRQGR